MKIHCPVCDQEYDVPDDYFGKRAECELCRNKFNISRICLLDNSISFSEFDKFFEIDQALIRAKFCNANMQFENCVSELEGIAKAVVFDNKLDNNEIKMIAEWIIKHEEHLIKYPLNRLKELFEIPLVTGITDNWRNTVIRFLKDLSNNTLNQEMFDNINNIEFTSNHFLLSGDFKNGMKRSDILKMIKEIGGIPSTSKTVPKKIDYLIVGEAGSEAWRFGNYGRKIERAIELRESTGKPKIIKESDFLKFI